MARAYNIYVVLCHNVAGRSRVVAAFTVKRELFEWLDRNDPQGRYEIITTKDNPPS